MDIGAPELLSIFLIVLLIFGPGRILQLGRELGEGIRNFREGLETSSEVDGEEGERPP